VLCGGVSSDCVVVLDLSVFVEGMCVGCVLWGVSLRCGLVVGGVLFVR
jgi:hypothetical protein